MANDPFADFPATFQRAPTPSSATLPAAGGDDPFAAFPAAERTSSNAARDAPVKPMSSPAEQRILAEHPELAPGAAPKGKWSDIGQAITSGVNAGAADLVGLPMDVANNITNLGKAGIEAGMLALGKTPPTWLDPVRDASTVPGTSEWAKAVIRKHGGANLIDPTGDPSNPDLPAIHGAAEIVGPGGLAHGAASVRAAAEGAGLLSSDAAVGAAPKPGVASDFPAVKPAASVPAEPLNATGAPRAAAWEPPSEPAPKFEEASTPPAGETAALLPAEEQARRAEVLKSIGLNEARESALTGDRKAAASDFQTSQLDSTVGNYASGLLDRERSALTAHADKIVADTGGTAGTDQNALTSRGAAIVKPLDDLKDHFDNQIRALYGQADERARGTPINMPRLHAAVTDDTAGFLGTTEGEALLRGVQARMKSLGIVDKDGNANPVTVQQAEQFKQYLNNQWQPRTARLIRTLKDATDDDVTSAAGVDIYAQARAMRAQRARTLDDPDGIAKLMDSSGPDGINRAVATEQIPDALARLPVAQFGHVIKTLKLVPPELQPQATEALNEIRAHLASRVQEAGSNLQGMWNHKAVSRYLNQNAARLSLVFSPVEMQQFRTLNDAGNILRIERGYPGAAAQAHNLMQRGVLAAADKAATGAAALGLHVGGPVGAAVGYGAGGAVGRGAKAFVDKAGLAGFRKQRVRPL